jgi:hypothetical protein
VFAVPAQPVLERRPLDVQKTQFLLAGSDDHAALGERLLELADVADPDAFRRANTPPHRFDPPPRRCSSSARCRTGSRRTAAAPCSTGSSASR